MTTAVEWLVEKLTNGHYLDEGMKQKIIEQANKMFEEQIKRAFIQGEYNIYVKNAEQYYNETFKSE